ncbi:MAG: LysR family transcriptional regulator [Bacteroidota bacterium]
MIKVEGRLWVNSGELPLLGIGRIELLEKIGELGSLRKAAAEMKMSYRQAWFNINEMNTNAGKPLVILKRGGKDGGIAEVTKTGRNVIKQFRQLQKDFNIFLKEKSKSFKI